MNCDDVFNSVATRSRAVLLECTEAKALRHLGCKVDLVLLIALCSGRHLIGSCGSPLRAVVVQRCRLRPRHYIPVLRNVSTIHPRRVQVTAWGGYMNAQVFHLLGHELCGYLEANKNPIPRGPLRNLREVPARASDGVRSQLCAGTATSQTAGVKARAVRRVKQTAT